MQYPIVTLLAPILRPQLYLDPGSGSFLIQLLIAGIVGAGFIVKVYWKKIKGLFSRSETKNEDEIEPRQ